ncbi:MAG: hypothetical protein KJ043_19300, partial [Anaerolineae bacterium]|nr:hypothetical protein [Anaerolineae bacterium]
DLSGTVTITNSNFTLGRIRNFYISNITNTITTTITNSTFNDTRTSGVGLDNLQVYMGGTAQANVNIVGGSFLASGTNQIDVDARDTAVVNEFDIVGITMNNSGGPSSGIAMDAIGNSLINFNIDNNPVLYSRDENVITISAGGDGDIQGRITNNPDMQFTTSSAGGSTFGIVRLLSDGTTSTVTVLIENNTMSLNNGTDGINASVQGANAAQINVTINNNNISASGTAGIPLEAINAFTNPTASAAKFLCVDVTDNDVTGIWARAFRIRQFSGVVQMEGFAIDVNTTWLARGNTGAPTAFLNTIVAGICNMPTNPLP